MTHAIITGGSSGIGLSLAKLMLSRSYRVSLIARRLELLSDAKRQLVKDTGCPENYVHIATGDVSDDVALKQALANCEAAHGACDLLVTCAGIVEPCPLNKAHSTDLSAQVSVNLIGTIQTIHPIYKAMAKRRNGHIMVVSSGAAFIGLYGYTAYCASKWGLRGFIEALRSEARDHNVKIGICYPPDTLTPQYFGELAKRPAQAVALMGKVKPVQPDYVAQRIMSALDKGCSTVNFGISLRLLATIGPILNPVVHAYGRLVYAFNRTPKST